MFRTPSKLFKRDSVKDEEKAESSTREDQREDDRNPEKKKPSKKSRAPTPPAEMTEQVDSEWTKIPDKLPIRTSESYSRWRYDIEIILRVRDLWMIIQGKEKVPKDPGDSADSASKASYRKELNAWFLKDNKAKEVLTRSLDGRHHDMIRSCKWAQNIWSTIKAVYEQNTGTSVLHVMRELHDIKWTQGDSVMGFFGRIRTVANKAEALDAAIAESQILAKIMSEAPVIYTPLKESWEVSMLSGAELTIDQLLGQMVRVERQHEMTKATEEVIKYNSAYAVKNKVQHIPNCDNCGKRGHLKPACWMPGAGAHHRQQGNPDRQQNGKNQEQRNKNNGAAATAVPRANVGF